ncbi:retrovirus-related pol polyprotein from transposon TNT 1-94, partial [Tanacetum coccineum]
MKKMYCLVVTDDYSKFTCVFFLDSKDETNEILKSFITGIENLVDHKVKVIRCDNWAEFKNKEMNQFCEMKGIFRQFSVARNPQQNGVAKRRNKILIKAARTMLPDSKLPTTFWVEAVNTACYVQNRVLVVKPHNKTPYELFNDRTPTLSFMRPFGCSVTILNTIDHLSKFDGKADEGFLVGYYLNSKVLRVFNSRTRIVEENLHIRFSESTPNVTGSGPDWLFDIDALTRTMNYEPIVAEPVKDYILLPLWTVDPPFSQNPKSSDDDAFKPSSDVEKKVNEDPRKESECNDQEKEDNVNITNNVNAASTNEVNIVGAKISIEPPIDPNMPALEDISIFDFSRSDEDDDAKADMNNLDKTIKVSPISTTRIHKDHPLNQVIGDLKSSIQTRNISKNLEEYGKNPKRIEAIRLFLADASFKDFVVYQMDVKSAFLYGKIEEEVYVCQPLGFEDPDFPDRVYKVEKALYGLHQAPRAWYKDEFYRRTYIFLGLQVQKKKDGIFISKDKYVDEILKKFRFIEVKIARTPIETQKPLLKDEDGKEVDVHMYRSMIGSLMYLTSSRPEIMFVVYACARYQVNPNVLHLYAVKRIFKYLKGQPKMGLWYPKDSPFDLVAYTNSDYAGASLDRKSTIRGCQSLRCRLISWHCKIQTVVANSTTEAEYMAASSCCGQVLWIQNQLLDYGDCNEKKLIQMVKIHTDKNVTDLLTKAFDVRKAKKSVKLMMEKLFRMELELLLVTQNKAVYKELGDRLVRVATTASSLGAEQDSGPGCQETMGDTIAQTRFENVSKLSNDSLLTIGNTLRSDEDRLKLDELMELCTNLQTRVLDLEKTKTTQHIEIDSLKRRVKKLEKKRSLRTHKLKRLYKVGLSARVESSRDEQELGEDASKQGRRINVIDVDEDITLVNVQDDVDNEMFDVNALNDEEVFVVEQEVATNEKDDNGEITLAQALIEMKSTKPKVKGIVFQELGKSTTTTTTISSQQSQDKGKRIMIEEPMKPMK